MPEDPSLLAELPTMPGVTLDGVDEATQRDMFEAFGLSVQYDKRRSEAEMWVTITDRMVKLLSEAQRGLAALPGPHLWPCPPPRGEGFEYGPGQRVM
jgi:hypothetical protein